MQLRYNDTDDAFEISVPQKMAVFLGLVLESLVGIGVNIFLIHVLMCGTTSLNGIIRHIVAIGSSHKTIFLALNALKAHVYFIETCQYYLSYVITVGCYYASAATAVFIAISGLVRLNLIHAACKGSSVPSWAEESKQGKTTAVLSALGEGLALTMTALLAMAPGEKLTFLQACSDQNKNAGQIEANDAGWGFTTYHAIAMVFHGVGLLTTGASAVVMFLYERQMRTSNGQNNETGISRPTTTQQVSENYRRYTSGLQSIGYAHAVSMASWALLFLHAPPLPPTSVSQSGAPADGEGLDYVMGMALILGFFYGMLSPSVIILASSEIRRAAWDRVVFISTKLRTFLGCLDVSCPEESNVQTGDNDVFVVSEDCKNKLTTKMPSSDSYRKNSVSDNRDHKDDLVDMDNQQKTLGTETPVKIFTTTETGNIVKKVNGLEEKPASDPNNLDLEAADLDLAQRLSRCGIRLSSPSPCLMMNNSDKPGAHRWASPRKQEMESPKKRLAAPTEIEAQHIISTDPTYVERKKDGHSAASTSGKGGRRSLEESGKDGSLESKGSVTPAHRRLLRAWSKSGFS